MKVLYGKEYIHIDAHSHLRIRISMLRYTYIYLAIFCFELERILKIFPLCRRSQEHAVEPRLSHLASRHVSPIHLDRFSNHIRLPHINIDDL